MNAIIKNFIYVLRKFRTSSILNILGLSAAFAVFTVTMIQVYYDFSYDTYFKNADRIQLVSIYNHAEDQYLWNVSTPTCDELADKLSEIEAYCAVQENKYFPYDVLDSYGVRQTIESTRYLVTKGFADVFSPKVVAGNIILILNDPSKVMLNESVARKFFGNEDPIGKTIFVSTRTEPITVECIIEDFPSNCTFTNGVFRSFTGDLAVNQSYGGYFLIAPGSRDRLVERANSTDYLPADVLEDFAKHPEHKKTIGFTPLPKVHLHFPAKGSGSLATTLSLLAIGLITLVIAYINFLNFSIAMSPARMRTLNIQKILGANISTLRFVIVAEAALFSFIAFALALVYIVLINNTSISEMFTANLALGSNIPLLSVIGFSAIVLGLLSGIYPAYYITSGKSIDVLKGTGGQAPRNSSLRNILIVIQFVVAISLITISLFINKQNNFMQDYQWGIQKDNVVYVNKTNFSSVFMDVDTRTFGEELKKDSRILDYTASQFIPGRIYMGWARPFEGKSVGIASWPVNDSFLKFFGVDMLEGDDFLVYNNPEKVKVIFNNVFVNKYEFDNSIIGKEFQCFSDPGTIVGISQDINFESLKESIRPMAFVTLGERYDFYVFIRISGNDTRGAIKHIEDTWTKFSKNECKVYFLDENLNTLYEKETNLSNLISLFSFITIIISIMGVYGLITFNSKYRAKEIAIRKVTGAKEMEIMILLNKLMFIQFVIAFVLAVPIAYYTVNKWLEGFAYRTTIDWWVFLMAGVIVLIITIVTVSVQSYRAATTNPVNSLKSE